MPIPRGMGRSSVVAIAAGFALLRAPDARAQCRFAEAPSRATWTYRFRAETGTDGLVLHVTAQVPLGPSGVVTVQLPTRWAGETHHAMTDLRSGSADVRLEVDTTGGAGVLRGRRGGTATVLYDLRKDWTGPLVHPLQFHPVLTPDYFEVTGQNALVFPQLATAAGKVAATTLQLDFSQLPSSWNVATSFGAGSSPDARCQVATVPAIEIVHALFAAGDFRLRQFSIGRRPAILAVRGTWTFSDEDAISQIQKAVGVVRQFWNDDQFPYFLVTLKPYDRDHGSSDGSEFTNAFWMYGSRLDSIDGLLPQLAHESFHAWNPTRMGVRPKGEQIDWFTEGLTDYYAYRLLLQADVLSATDYVDSMNRALRRFPGSSDPYIRGRVIGLWLDAAIRQKSHDRRSLDDVMFEMTRTRDRPLTQKRILRTIAPYVSAEDRSALDAAVTRRAALALPDHVPSVTRCVQRSSVDVPTFDPGFDIAASRTAGKVIGVRAGSAAYVAGLREGQTLSGRMSLTNNEPEHAVIVGIRDDAGERELQFLPKGPPAQAWQYRLGDCVERTVTADSRRTGDRPSARHLATREE
jgi:predicted metalloprotease with PDZ domain